MPTRRLSYLLAALPQLFWAGNMIVGRWMHVEIPPLALAFWRWAAASMILLPVAWKHLWPRRHLLRAHWRALTGLGLIGVTGFNTMVYLGLQSTTAANASVLASTTPVIIVALSYLLLGQRIGWQGAGGILFSGAGVLVILARGQLGVLFALKFNAGDLWNTAASVLWALYSVCLRWRPAGLSPLGFLAVISLIGVVPLGPLYLWELDHVGAVAVTVETVGSIAYLALFPSVLAYVLWNRAVEDLGANRSGQMLHLLPVFGTLLAVMLLGERLHAYHGLGIGLIAFGLWLADRES